MAANHLVGGSKTWVPRYRFLGVDFLHNHQGVRIWLEGRDPYREMINAEDHGSPYSYPPLVLRLFTWTALLPPRVGVAVWIAVLALLATVGAWACWRQRDALGLEQVPFPLVLAFMLWSMPVVYALERGNYDLVALMFLIMTAAMLRRSEAWADWLAGACLAVAAGLKVYPVLGGLVFLVLRRPHAVLGAFAAGGCVVLADLPGTMQFLQNSQSVFEQHIPAVHGKLHETMHTLSGSWALLWHGTPFEWLARVPGPAAWAALMLPPLAWVSYHLARCQEPERLALTYLMWVTSVATFLPFVSNDYNLFYLPLAAVAVWDRRDPLVAHVLLGLMVVWWQPFLLPIGPRLLLMCKVAGVYAIALCLVRRLREQASAAAASVRLAAPDQRARLTAA